MGIFSEFFAVFQKGSGANPGTHRLRKGGGRVRLSSPLQWDPIFGNETLSDRWTLWRKWDPIWQRDPSCRGRSLTAGRLCAFVATLTSSRWFYELYGRAAILSRLSGRRWKTGLPSLSLLTLSFAASPMVERRDQ
jgi:hypothetical protein